MHRHHSRVNHIHQLALHSPRRRLQESKSKLPESTQNSASRRTILSHFQTIQYNPLARITDYNPREQIKTLNLSNPTKSNRTSVTERGDESGA
jgi:hypothetical protein